MLCRIIGENIRQISDITKITSLCNIPGLIILIDFEKAFETLEWDYLDNVLETFNFRDNFRKWVKILYKNACSAVINNGYLSEFFKIERGIRQGCPLSAYLFILVVETLAISIRNDQKIL